MTDWHERFQALFKAVSACEAPEGTQVDDVLAEFAGDYDRATAVTDTALVVWEVEVFADEVAEVTPTAVARKAYDRITSHQMLPILEVRMGDGTKHTIDIEEVGA